MAKFAGATGAYVWSKNFWNTSDDVGLGVAVDGQGDVVVTGDFLGTIDFGGGRLLTAGALDIFLVKLTGGSGGYVWARRIGGRGSDAGQAIAVDPNGDVVVTGSFADTVDFGGGPLALQAGFSDVFVAKYAGADGAYRWAKNFANTYDDTGYAIAADGAGNVVVAGSSRGRSTWDRSPDRRGLVGVTDIFVAKFSGAGTPSWAKRFGATNEDEAWGIG